MMWEHDPMELDLKVMTDLGGDPPDHYTVYYIGWPQELDAGFYGGMVSETFRSYEEAREWFDDNYDRLNAEMDDEN